MNEKKITLEEKIDVKEVVEMMKRMPNDERFQMICIMKGFELARQSKKVLAEGA